MNNLEQIKKAWRMGWSAVIVFHDWNEAHTVVNVSEESLMVNFRSADNQVFKRTYKELEKSHFFIKGYKYAGELAGNEPIPEGQKFRVKETGEIITCTKSDEDTIYFIVKEKGHYPCQGISKINAEPYFN